MPNQVLWLAVPLAIVLAGVAGGRLLSSWFRYRGARAIVCPENCNPAGVSVDAGHAALTAFGGSPDLRLSSCSLGPERAVCGQQCLLQIEASPDGCLVRKMLARWYDGKSCALCGRPFGEIEWTVQKPALICADKVSVECSQVPAERLTETLQTALPVCFACHLANTLVRERPALIIDRSRGITQRS
jgi:hypothetical protein